jgi:hypothetical protein
MFEDIAAKILNGRFQDFWPSTARQLTSCLKGRELTAASALNCDHKSSISTPAVRRRQPSCDRHHARFNRDFSRETYSRSLGGSGADATGKD